MLIGFLRAQVPKSGGIVRVEERDDASDSKLEKGLENLTHVIELSGFPTEFQTVDLITVLGNSTNDPCNIRWVDPSHALGVFASENIGKTCRISRR